jgi:hypothetical protein
MYSNFAVHGADIWNGVGAISDADFNGTAEEYLGISSCMIKKLCSS